MGQFCRWPKCSSIEKPKLGHKAEGFPISLAGAIGRRLLPRRDELQLDIGGFTMAEVARLPGVPLHFDRSVILNHRPKLVGVPARYSLTDAPGGAACGVRVSLGHCRLPLSTVRATSLAQVKVEKQRFGINDTGFANRSTTDPQHPLWWACQHSPAQIRYFLRHLQQIVIWPAILTP